MATEVSPRGWHEVAMQLDLGGHPARAGSKRAPGDKQGTTRS
jgi:hypothetical protein